jgi:hypothetical protein
MPQSGPTSAFFWYNGAIVRGRLYSGNTSAKVREYGGRSTLASFFEADRSSTLLARDYITKSRGPQTWRSALPKRGHV